MKLHIVLALKAILFLAIPSAATPIYTSKYSRGELFVHESRSKPEGFSRLRPAPGNEVVNFRIALTQSNVSGLRERLSSISTPNDPSYGNFMTQAEVCFTPAIARLLAQLFQIDEYVKPHNNTSTTVKNFLSENNIPYKYLTSAGDWLGISIPISKASEVFNTTFHVFQHDRTGTLGIRALSYSIPKYLKGHVDNIHPMIRYTLIHYNPRMNH